MRDQIQTRAEALPPSVHHQADHFVAAGRVFNMLLKVGRGMGLSRADSVARANDVARQTSGVDLVALMGVEEITRPAQIRQADIEALAEQLAEWLEAQSGAEYTSETLMREALGNATPEQGDYSLLAAAMRSLGWRHQRIRNAAGMQRQGYRKTTTH